MTYFLPEMAGMPKLARPFWSVLVGTGDGTSCKPQGSYLSKCEVMLTGMVATAGRQGSVSCTRETGKCELYQGDREV